NRWTPLLADVVDVGYGFPRAVGLFLPDHEVLAFFVFHFSFFLFGLLVVGAVFVGDVAGAGDFDVGGLKRQARAGLREFRFPGELDGVFAGDFRAVVDEKDRIVGVVGSGFVEVFGLRGFAPIGGSGADGGFVGFARVGWRRGLLRGLVGAGDGDARGE